MGAHSEEHLFKYQHVKKTKPKQQISVSFNLLCQTIVAHTEAVKFVLKAKPQSAVVDADHFIDFNPRDAVKV